MILTLEEAIEREEDTVAKNERFCEVAPPEMTAEAYHSATYHRQIAEWLKELAGRKTGKWHPYPKEKPKETGRYLTTNKQGRVDITRWGKMLFPDKTKKPVWYDSDSEWGDYKVDDVVAWMPLPESYKEVDE